MVSITEHADDSPTGKLMEAIIESVDEFYSENLAQEVVRGMREAASRGFWVASRVPYGYRKLMVQDGAKKRPTLEPDPATSAVVERIFRMAALPRSQEGASPKSRQHLPPQRAGQVQGVQPRPLRPGRQERKVHLLRLPVGDEARQRGVRRPQAQRAALRGVGGGEDSGEPAHRVQHPSVGEAGGQGDGRSGSGAASQAGDRRGGAGGREAQAGTALRPGGDH